jgi:hypothetical protein
MVYVALSAGVSAMAGETPNTKAVAAMKLNNDRLIIGRSFQRLNEI